ncbi:unnamed protein product [Kuraishia capsulata CBS 1993]|uniref:Sphingoid long-chain base transporter RSB1 n=1 Tax=Kuraishia capsulata CBS 1993 TaxID=1382522 RepID=W6ML59_9ASCO|nr:uncharacterized protein KUCA_T00001467001 [Kuraishia capsulata CBS 1993]CDK25497.1 unnamed protein product [Kuraishia capsulata CBS 1993]
MTSTLASKYASEYSHYASEYSSITAALATETHHVSTIVLQKSLEYVSVSLDLLSNLQVLATATESKVIQSAAAAVQTAQVSAIAIENDNSIYGSLNPSLGGNAACAAVMGVFLVAHILFGTYFRQWWMLWSFSCGTFLEFIGYIGRSLSHNHREEENPFLLQIICLTLAPCFIMAGIYYMLAKITTIYGAHLSKLKPMWYSNIFIACDLVAIILQGAGGGIAAVSLQTYSSSDNGTHIMVGGLAVQVATMILFQYFWYDFLYALYKQKRAARAAGLDIDSQFNPKYADLRARRLFSTFPIAISIAVLFVFIRCIYRLVELSEGWTGFLIEHEVYFMILDALMMCLAILLMTIYHPGFVFGRDSYIPVKGMKLGRKKHIDALDQEMEQQKHQETQEIRRNSIEESSLLS